MVVGKAAAPAKGGCFDATQFSRAVTGTPKGAEEGALAAAEAGSAAAESLPRQPPQQVLDFCPRRRRHRRRRHRCAALDISPRRGRPVSV